LTDLLKETSFTRISPLRILLVDYDTDSIEILNILLTLDGHSVQSASDGKNALRLAGTFQPQVVLLNPILQDMEAGKMVEDLSWALPGTLLIAIVDWQEVNENPLHWQEAGFDHHLLKPVRIEAVLDLLKQ
jgi:DNA-binding response OmpR family regulator